VKKLKGVDIWRRYGQTFAAYFLGSPCTQYYIVNLQQRTAVWDSETVSTRSGLFSKS